MKVKLKSFNQNMHWRATRGQLVAIAIPKKLKKIYLFIYVVESNSTKVVKVSKKQV
jgi:hypothetical protein